MESNLPDFRQLRIVENSPITRDCRLLKLESREISHEGKPGQYLNIKVSPDAELRPFSFCRLRPDENSIHIVYKVSGPGTTWLSKKSASESLAAIGPLGVAFAIPKGSERIALVAGGTGLTPLICLGEKAAKLEKEIYFFLGLKEKAAMPVPESMLSFIPKERRHFATMDGSLGIKGDIVAHFASFLEKTRIDYLAGCGPKPMLEALRSLALERKIPSEFCR